MSIAVQDRTSVEGSDMLSSVDLLSLQAHWCWPSVGGRVDLKTDLRTSLSRHFMRCDCNWPVIIEAAYGCLLWELHNCGGFQDF